MLQVGDYAPWFTMQRTDGPSFNLQERAGKYVVVCFFGSASYPFSRRILDDVERLGGAFHAKEIVFVGISTDPADARLRPHHENEFYLCDANRRLGSMYEVFSNDMRQLHPQTLILDAMLRVLSVLPFDGPAESYVPGLLDKLDALPPLKTVTGHAPILILPNVFEPQFCREVIRQFDQQEGRDGGIMLDVDGRSQVIIDHNVKSRWEHEFNTPEFAQAVHIRIKRRLVPELRRAFQFDAGCLERHLVSCYHAAQGGIFRAHRDNQNTMTAHRKFAISINLNDDFEGGEVWFPEYGSRGYKGPTGAAVVFSCTLLHEAKLVTKGRRYVYLPFLYDRAGFVQRILLQLKYNRRSILPNDDGTVDDLTRARQIAEAHFQNNGL